MGKYSIVISFALYNNITTFTGEKTEAEKG